MNTRVRVVQPQDLTSLMMFRALYLNGRRRRIKGDLALQMGAEKEPDVVIMAEALDDQARRNQHGAYNLVLSTAYPAVYMGEGRDITCRKKVGHDRGDLGGVPPTTPESARGVSEDRTDDGRRDDHTGSELLRRNQEEEDGGTHRATRSRRI